MIVKMNKYAYLVYHKEYDSFLERLRSLGVVHVKNASDSIAEPAIIQELTAKEKRAKTQIAFLESLLPDDIASKPEATKQDYELIISQIETLREKSAKVQSAIASLEKEREAFTVWGDFSYDTIAKIRQSGYITSFYTCQKSHFDNEWLSKNNAFVINEVQSNVYFLTLTPIGFPVAVDADQVKLPSRDYNHICSEIDAAGREKAEIDATLLEIARDYTAPLKKYKTEIENQIAWSQTVAKTSSEAGDKLMLLEGWIPNDKTAEMAAALEKEGYYCQPLDITDDDVIPIKLKNNRFTRLFEPITQLYSLPNYAEFDPTPLFAPFFMLFFGLCFGDGGYGLLLIAVALIMKNKVSVSMRPILTLLLYFGAATLVIGILTGSFFGVSLIEIKAFASIKNYFLTSQNLMIISLVIGFVHVIYGKFVAAMKIKIQRGFKYSLSAFAWIFLILSGACILALPMMTQIVLPKPLEYFLYGVAGISAAIALLYNTPGKNVFLNFGSGLWATYNTVSGLVGDVLSYIRLYAIGLTGALLGGVFNSMAIDMTASISPFIRWLPMLLILLVGHALNIGLSLISSLVHPLRLIYVEYYKNSEFEGGGLDYKPFRKL